jgi:predicted nucleotidyltransferase
MAEDVFRRLQEVAARAFEGEPVVFAYLFGSQATGKTHPRSDVDVAVYLEASVPRDRYLDYRLKLPAGLEKARVGNVEVIVLNNVPLRLRGRVLREGKLLYSRDEPARVRYVSKTLREFFDFEIHSRPLDEKFLRDIASGIR